ncbi:MAG: hypothetical protein ACR652_18460 [Methylocystis sp.]|uniref:hypothetical protein n=1 Tax=Methylocystis sp. TaxID=1911079 RepID=UPI003DA28891
MLEPKSIEVQTQAGVTRTYTISKFPAVAGREIVAKYPLSGMPKLGDYAVNEETMLKLMAFVAATPPSGGDPVQLTTRALVDNHVPDWETLAKLEIAMMEYNVSFFGNGRASGFFEGIAQKLPALLTKILTDSLRQLSEKNKQRSTN